VWGVYNLWGGVGAKSRFVLDKGGMDWGCFGDCVKIPFHVYLQLSISGLHFLYVQCTRILEKLYYLWTKSKVLLYYTGCFTTLGHNCRR